MASKKKTATLLLLLPLIFFLIPAGTKQKFIHAHTPSALRFYICMLNNCGALRRWSRPGLMNFRRCRGGRGVGIGRRGRDWDDGWWFAGVPQENQ